MSKKYTLHMKSSADGILSYPFIINEQGFVGRQKFWKGHPKRLLGFNSTPMAGDMDIVTFINKSSIPAEDIMLGIDYYPVFADDADNWFTFGMAVENITEVKK